MVEMSCHPSASEQVVVNVCACSALLDPLLGSLTPLLGGLFAPFQSPASGVSPACPNMVWMIWFPNGGRRKKVVTPVLKSRRKMPTSSTPSPSQSPATGRSPVRPKVNGGSWSKAVVGKGTQPKQG